ncbi:MAG TPA: hypothetical protein VHT96_16540 [Clostridia bacterium]|nr:hypothetical protein [Clostridia bacterium]
MYGFNRENTQVMPAQNTFNPTEAMPTQNMYNPAAAMPMQNMYNPAAAMPMQNMYNPAAAMPMQNMYNPAAAMPMQNMYNPAAAMPMQNIYNPAATMPAQTAPTEVSPAEQLENMYPETYNIIKPEVEKACDNLMKKKGGKCPTKEEVESTANEISKKVEPAVEAAVKKSHSSEERQFSFGGRRILSDFVVALILADLIRRRPFFNPGFYGYPYSFYPAFPGAFYGTYPYFY